MRTIGLCLILLVPITFWGQNPNYWLPWQLNWSDEFSNDSSLVKNWCRNDFRAYQFGRHDFNAFRTDPLAYPPDNIYFLSDPGSVNFVRLFVKNKTRGRISRNFSPPNQWEFHEYPYSAPSYLKSNFRFKYGYYEAKIRLPILNQNENNLGIGANFWLFYGYFDKDGQKFESEIDVVEFTGIPQNHTHTCNVHFYSPQVKPSGKHDLGSTKNGPQDGLFHTYGVWWSPGTIKFYIDGIFYRESKNFTAEIADDLIPMQILLDINVFTGGEAPDSTTKFPYNYDIDYVRVYQLDMEHCQEDYNNPNPMPALPSVYRNITFGGGSYVHNAGSTKSLTANTSISIQPDFEAKLGSELILDIYPHCHKNEMTPCNDCGDCD